MACTEWLVLPPCFTYGETEAQRGCDLLRSARKSGSELIPIPGCQVLVGPRKRQGGLRGRQVAAPWGAPK